MLLMMVAIHSPESCPASNPKYRPQTLAYFEKIETLNKKYGIKAIGSWTDHPAHTIYAVFDAPNMESTMALFNEPELQAQFAYQSVRIFPVITGEETYKIVKQAK